MKFRCHNLNNLFFLLLSSCLLHGCSIKKNKSDISRNSLRDTLFCDSIDMTATKKDREIIAIRETYDSLSGMIKNKEIRMISTHNSSLRDKTVKKERLTDLNNENMDFMEENSEPHFSLEKDFYLFIASLLLSLFIYLKFYYKK